MGMSDPMKVSAVLNTGVKSCVPAVATTVIFSFFINLLAFTSPLYMLQIYDRVIGSRSEVTLLGITILVGYLLVINALLEMLRSRLLMQASLAFDGKLAGAVFDATAFGRIAMAAARAGAVAARPGCSTRIRSRSGADRDM